MKKNRILSVAALLMVSLIVSACTVSVQRDRPIRDYTFQSSWRIADTNKWASCENLETIFEYTFFAENPANIESITEHYRGQISGVKKEIDVPSWQVNGNRVTVQAVFRANGAFLPLADQSDLSPQAIVPRPVPPPPSDRGTTEFWIVVESDDLLQPEFTSRITPVTVVSNCPAR